MSKLTKSNRRLLEQPEKLSECGENIGSADRGNGLNSPRACGG